ncbi:MAG: hypothetical protein J3Q66DRAFT_425721 [Benniella sp.]|nr:MAG: hypothetical protein J3Q66DRAFT_425721 [Benniella sp.]
MTALKDVSFTDHLVERISALEGWTSLFGNMWDSSDDAQTMVVAETMIGKVYKQLADGYVQAHSANAFSAITVRQYLSTLSLHYTFGGCWMRNLFRPFSEAVLRGRISEAVLRGRSQRPFSEAVLRRPFPEAFSEAVLRGRSQRSFSEASAIVFRLTLPRPTNLCLSAAVALPSSSQASRTTTTEEEAAAVEKIKNITQKDLESFQQQVFSSQALARLLSAPWVLAFSDRTAASPEERKELADLLDRTLLAATSRGFAASTLQLYSSILPHDSHQSRGEKPFLERDLGLHRTHPLVGQSYSDHSNNCCTSYCCGALASLFGVDWSRGPTVTSSGSHGLLSYLASPINPRAMASVKNPAPLTLIELSELSSISITAATASGGAAGSAVHAIVTLGRKTPFMCPDLSEVWWACRPWPILLELLEELEGIFQVDGEKAE